MWYCGYKLYHTSNDLKVVAEEEPLRIRDAYFGGRTNAIKLKEEFLMKLKEDTLISVVYILTY